MVIVKDSWRAGVEKGLDHPTERSIPTATDRFIMEVITELVRQDDKAGCTIACMAMVLGKTYQEVKADFVGEFRGQDDGLTLDEVADYLSDHGFQSIHKTIVFRGVGTDWGREFLLQPFAPIHIVRLRFKFNTTHHVVVMKANGELLDPDGKSDAEIRQSYLIMSCLGLFNE